MTDADLAADGLMPRNAFASIEDWDRSVLNATNRVCDSYQLFNDADGSPAFMNGSPSQHAAKIAGPWLPTQPNRSHDGSTGTDCNCVNDYGSPGYAGWADDGSWTGYARTQHVAQYGYSWVPTLAPNGGTDPSLATDSIWVGGSGLFTINNNTEILQQTGIEDWWQPLTAFPHSPGVQPQDELFWECIEPPSNPPPCDAPHQWDGSSVGKTVQIGDEITMYTSGNYHWNEDDTRGLIDSGNYGPQPNLDSSEWITEDPDCSPNCGLQPLANYGNTGMADMKWLDGYNNWRDASDDTDYILYAAHNPVTHDYTEQAGSTFPYYINSFWNWGISVWWLSTY